MILGARHCPSSVVTRLAFEGLTSQSWLPPVKARLCACIRSVRLNLACGGDAAAKSSELRADCTCPGWVTPIVRRGFPEA